MKSDRVRIITTIRCGGYADMNRTMKAIEEEEE